MNQKWSDFRIVNTVPKESTHTRLEDATWDVFLMWAAGPCWVIATPVRHPREDVVAVSTGPGGTLEHESQPFSESDQASIDDQLDAELAAASVPPRPRGLDWYIRLTDLQWRTLRHKVGPRIEAGLPGTIDAREYHVHIHAAMNRLVPDVLASSISDPLGP